MSSRGQHGKCYIMPVLPDGGSFHTFPHEGLMKASTPKTRADVVPSTEPAAAETLHGRVRVRRDLLPQLVKSEGTSGVNSCDADLDVESPKKGFCKIIDDWDDCDLFSLTCDAVADCSLVSGDLLEWSEDIPAEFRAKLRDSVGENAAGPSSSPTPHTATSTEQNVTDDLECQPQSADQPHVDGDEHDEGAERLRQLVELLSDPNEPSSDGSFVCVDCDEAMSSDETLSKHRLESHERLPRFQCNKCQKCFRRLSDRLLHQCTATVGDRLQCVACPSAYSDNGLVHLHVSSHFLPTAFNCLICGMAFEYRSGLREHFGREHPAPMIPARIPLLSHSQ